MTEFHPVTGLASGSFGIGTFRNQEASDFPALVLPDGVTFDLSHWYRDTHALLDDWDRALERLNDLAHRRDRKELRFETLQARPVLAHPNVLGAGANYRQHVAEMMTHNKFNQHNRKPGESDEQFFARNLAEVDRRAREGMPFFWIGLHSSLVGANDDVVLPLIGEQPDWELELGVIVRASGRYLRPDEAGSLIAGYVIVNDLGMVDEFRRADVRWGFDWVSKSQPSFKPLGPFIVPKEFVDRSKVRIQLQVNGQTMQDWPVTDMIFSPEQILSYATERIRLLPGDLLLTGSPPGNGAMMGRFLKPGDTVESRLTYLGHQKNRVIAEDSSGRKPTYGRFITEW
jgi:2-keto-4-pentenoate hydratase/2-oxohepta-3-ene-1,7-dioic acid hydratase in catechol pathway